MVSYCLIILVVYTQQISAADFLSKSSQQIFSDLLSIFSADLLSRSFAVVRGWWSAIVLSFAVSFAVVRGWWSAIVLSFWWSILHEFFRRTLSRSFREQQIKNKLIYLRGRVSQRREDHSGNRSLTVHRTRRETQQYTCETSTWLTYYFCIITNIHHLYQRKFR